MSNTEVSIVNVTLTSGNVFWVPTSGLLMLYLVLEYLTLDVPNSGCSNFWYNQNGLRYLLLEYLIQFLR